MLKVANPAFSRVEIEAQDAAARFVADADPTRARAPATSGCPVYAPIAEISDGAGGLLYARIITYLAGGTMSGERLHRAGPLGRAGRSGRAGQPGAGRHSTTPASTGCCSGICSTPTGPSTC